MRATLESIEKNQVSIHVEVEEEKVNGALNQAYRKVVKRVIIPGFRKGKAPRPILEAHLGKEVLYEDAMEILLAEAYEEAVQKTAIEPINKPEIDVVQLEEGKPFIFNAKVEVLPEVDLGEYKSISAVIPEVKIGDDEVEAQLRLVQQRYARLVDAGDKQVDDGDVAVIALETRVDGDIEPRLSQPDQIVEVGAAKFIPGLEAHLLGMKPAEEKNITMSLPSVFHYEDLEGKEAEFKVKVIAVKEKEYPELDDEFAKEVGECETLEELKESMRHNLEEIGQINARRIFKERVVAKVVDGVEVEIPETLLSQQLEVETNRFVQRMAMRRITVDDYLKMSNKDTDGLRLELEERARVEIKKRLVLNAVAKAEGIKVTPEELAEEIDLLAAQYNVDVDKIRADLEAKNQLSFLEEQLLYEKVQDFLAENAVALAEKPPQEGTGEQGEMSVADIKGEAQQKAGQEEDQPSQEL